MDDPATDTSQHWRDTFTRAASGPCDTTARNGFWLKAGTARLRSVVGALSGTPEGLDVLDAGCGDGTVSGHLAARNRVVGLDIVSGMLDLAAEKGLEPCLGSMEDPPFADASFDLVLVVESATLTADPQATIARLGRLVRPGGWLIVSCVNKGSWLRRAAEWVCDRLERPYPRALTLPQLEHAVAAAGLRTVARRAIVAGPGFALPVRLHGRTAALALCNNLVLMGKRSD